MGDKSMIEPKYFTLNALFAARVFQIPHYQRFYSWQTKQLNDLFEDLSDLYAKDSDQHHFMATLVCYRTGQLKYVKTAEYSVYEVVDGQQRITTLALLLRAIERRIEDEETRKDLSRILVKDDNNLLLLQTNNVNQHLFNRYLRDGTAPASDEIKAHSDQNLSGAIVAINGFLDAWLSEQKDLFGLLRLIRHKIGFVVYDTEDQLAVYSIFECLNSRGLAVDWLDKAKSMLMGVAFEKSQSPEAAKARIDELHNLWANIYSEMALHPISGQEILRIAATLFIGTTTGKALSAEDSIDKLSEYCVSSDQTIEVSGWFRQVAEKLVQLHKNRHWDAVTKVAQARILAIALMLTDSLTHDERETALEQWERVTFRIYSMCNKDARTKVGDYIKLSSQIIKKSVEASSCAEIFDRLKWLGEGYSVDSAVYSLLTNPRYAGFEEECRYILWRYEEYLAKEEGAHINKALRAQIWSARKASETIEHIFPQSTDKGSPWLEKGPRSSIAIKNTDRLGNLLLLPPGLNSQAGRKGFINKKDVYKRAEGLRMVRDVLSVPDWTTRAIDKREKKMKQFLTDTFADVT